MTDSPDQTVDAEVVPDTPSQLSPIAQDPLTPYTRALVSTWEAPIHRTSITANKLSVSQTVSFFAFMYEKLRNAVEFREEHLIRRAAIERIIKRRMLLNGNGRAIAGIMIKELLWARYYENNTIGEEKIREVQAIIDKYFFLRNEIAVGRPKPEQDKINDFFLEMLSCEIEEYISPDTKREAFINFAYQVLHEHIVLLQESDITLRDTQIYIAIHRTLAHNDNPVIKYDLLKLMLPTINQIDWKSADDIIPKLYDTYKNIQKQISYPLADKIRHAVKKHIPPFLILKDIFTTNTGKLSSILTNDDLLRQKVDEACRKRYAESRTRLRRTAVRSFIYILLTKVVFAVAVEVPYDLYVTKEIAFLPIAINVLVPPLLMAIIVMTVTVPGDDNTKRIYEQIKSIIDTRPEHATQRQATIKISGKGNQRSGMYNLVFGTIYLAMYCLSFGTIIWGLSSLHFNPVSQGIFLFFLTLVLFFTTRVLQITKEYQVVEKEFFLTPVFDLFFLPFIKVGKWISGEVLTKFNVIIIVLDFLIELPFKAIAEIFDEWMHFVKAKKEEVT